MGSNIASPHSWIILHGYNTLICFFSQSGSHETHLLARHAWPKLLPCPHVPRFPPLEGSIVNAVHSRHNVLTAPSSSHRLPHSSFRLRTIRSCPSNINPNCVSTASTNDTYGLAWRATETDPAAAAGVLVSGCGGRRGEQNRPGRGRWGSRECACGWGGGG